MIQSKMYPGAKIEVDESWVIADEAKTGRVTREGYERILEGVRFGSIDILLFDDISRTSRDMGDTLDLYDLLVFKKIEGYSISDQISTVDSNAKDLFIFKGYANESQSKAISKSTMRGLEIRAINGYSTGHCPYGFDSVASKVSMVKGIEKPSHFIPQINFEEAKVINRIWSLYADGMGCRSIATILNDEHIPSPGRGKTSGKPWSEKTIWNIVNQEKYVGVWKYKQTKVVKNPMLDRMTQQDRPANEWIIVEREDIRIIPAELAKKVEKRRAEDQEKKRKSKTRFIREGATPKHLFVGTLKCAECGGNFVMVSGKGYYGCFNAHQTLTDCQRRNENLVFNLTSQIISFRN